jgi:hypothetical protein
MDKFAGITIIVNEMLPNGTIMFNGGPRKQGETIEEYLRRHGLITNLATIASEEKKP